MDLQHQITNVKANIQKAVSVELLEALKVSGKGGKQIIPPTGWPDSFGPVPDPEHAITAFSVESFIKRDPDFYPKFRSALYVQRDNILTLRISKRDSTLPIRSHCKHCFGRGYSGINETYEVDPKTRKFKLDAEGKKVVKSQEYQICTCLLNKFPITPKDEEEFGTGVIKAAIDLQANVRNRLKEEQEKPSKPKGKKLAAPKKVSTNKGAKTKTPKDPKTPK